MLADDSISNISTATTDRPILASPCQGQKVKGQQRICSFSPHQLHLFITTHEAAKEHTQTNTANLIDCHNLLLETQHTGLQPTGH